MENGDEENDPDSTPVWNPYLYQVQQKAPKPRRILCQTTIENCPFQYGKEFHGAISREYAEQLVAEAEGSYLTRESQRQPGTYALTFRFAGAAKNYKLYYDEEEKTHFVGEKRFETINDLVEDGLITMYVNENAKDYIDSMALEAFAQQATQAASSPPEDKKTKPKEDRPKSNNTNRRKSFKPLDCAKQHNFKTHNFYGPHWCDHCKNFMWGLKAQGLKCQDCLFNAHKQCSLTLPPTCVPDRKLIKRVFGVDLTTLVKAYGWKRPTAVDACIKEIETRGVECEGLYRVSGFADDIETLKQSIDKDGLVPDLTATAVSDINIVAGLLKLFFRSLPIPLITFETYPDFIKAAKIKDIVERNEALHSAVSQLPPAHYETLKYLMQHLHRVAHFCDSNLMNAHNLGVVFGPTLLRSPDSEVSAFISDIPYQKLVVEYLITEQDVLFSS